MASASEVAKALGVTRQAVNKRAKKGSITREPDGTFDLEKVRAQWNKNADYHQQARSVQQKGERQPEDTSESSLHEAQRTNEWLKVHQRQLDVQERQGELVRADEVERVWGEIMVNVRNRILMIPGKLAQRLSTLSDVRECHALLDREVKEALTALAQAEASDAAA